MSTKQIAVVVGFGAVVLSVVLNLGIREWFSPDLRYQAGGYYRSANVDVATVSIRNLGHGTAEDITCLLSFPAKLTDISVTDPSVKMTITSGGVGHDTATLSLGRLVPGEGVYLFFSVEAASTLTTAIPADAVKKITHSSGHARTGEPLWTKVASFLLGLCMLTPLGFASGYYLSKRETDKTRRAIAEAMRRVATWVFVAACERKRGDEAVAKVIDDHIQESVYREQIMGGISDAQQSLQREDADQKD